MGVTVRRYGDVSITTLSTGLRLGRMSAAFKLGQRKAFSTDSDVGVCGPINPKLFWGPGSLKIKNKFCLPYLSVRAK